MAIEIDLMPVGRGGGDCIIIKYTGPSTKETLSIVGGGCARTGEQAIKHIKQYYDNIRIDHLVLSYASAAHAAGLIAILNQFEVGSLWMNLPWLYADEVTHLLDEKSGRAVWVENSKPKYPYLAQLEAIAASRQIPVRPAFQGTCIGSFVVQAPSRNRYVSLIPDFDKTSSPVHGAATNALAQPRSTESLTVESLDENPLPTCALSESSVVLLSVRDHKHLLLTGNVGPQGLMEAAEYAYWCGRLRPPDFIQIPNQARSGNVTPVVLNHWLGTFTTSFRGFACAAVGTSHRYEQERKKVTNAFIRRGYSVYLGRRHVLHHSLGSNDRPHLVAIQAEPFYEIAT